MVGESPHTQMACFCRRVPEQCMSCGTCGGDVCRDSVSAEAPPSFSNTVVEKVVVYYQGSSPTRMQLYGVAPCARAWPWVAGRRTPLAGGRRGAGLQARCEDRGGRRTGRRAAVHVACRGSLRSPSRRVRRRRGHSAHIHRHACSRRACGPVGVPPPAARAPSRDARGIELVAQKVAGLWLGGACGARAPGRGFPHVHTIICAIQMTKKRVVRPSITP